MFPVEKWIVAYQKRIFVLFKKASIFHLKFFSLSVLEITLTLHLLSLEYCRKQDRTQDWFSLPFVLLFKYLLNFLLALPTFWSKFLSTLQKKSWKVSTVALSSVILSPFTRSDDMSPPRFFLGFFKIGPKCFHKFCIPVIQNKHSGISYTGLVRWYLYIET